MSPGDKNLSPILSFCPLAAPSKGFRAFHFVPVWGQIVPWPSWERALELMTRVSYKIQPFQISPYKGFTCRYWRVKLYHTVKDTAGWEFIPKLKQALEGYPVSVVEKDRFAVLSWRNASG